MPIKSILEKFKTPEGGFESEDYVELDIEPTHAKEGQKILLDIDKLEDFADSDRVQRKLREGKIVLVRIKELKDKDIGELKRAISRIRKTCVAVNGDIVGVSDEWVIITPESVKINRGRSED